MKRIGKTLSLLGWIAVAILAAIALYVGASLAAPDCGVSYFMPVDCE